MGEQGVNFTRPAAKRISDVVQRVEKQPYPDNVLQRRRAGGLGRSTLWEIVSVETGTESCTIQRVENQDGDLVEASEKTDILYDTADEPSVGDRGLLIRLGEGSLFFFKRAAGILINRVYVTEHCYVNGSFPDSAFGYPNSAITTHRGGTPPTPDQLKGVFKFDTVIPSQAGIEQAKLLIGEMSATSIWIAPNSWLQYFANVQPILQDFDPSTLTWNQLAALSKGSATVFPFISMDPHGGAQSNGNGLAGGSISIAAASIANTWFGGSVYGFTISSSASGHTETHGSEYNTSKFQADRTATGNPPRYHCLLEWELT